MAYSVLSTVPGMTAEQYDGMVQLVGLDRLRAAPGFRLHVAGPAEGGWYVYEVWDAEADQQAWMRDVILPMMQAAGAPAPQQQPFPVHNLVAR